MTRPIIGLTVNYDDKGDYFSKLPWYALRENHCTSVCKEGGIPIGLAYTDCIDAYLDLIDGLIITGGDFDISPTYYGEDVSNARVYPINKRTEFELKMAEGALKRDMPVLGICGGQQLLNVLLGGSLIQHIPDTVQTDINHEQPNKRTEAGHAVIIEPGTLLSKCIGGKKEIMVNSAHHQAVKDVGPGMIVNARAPDGIIEGIEHPGYKFCLGTQWHPEYSITPADDAITRSLIEAAAG